jgi:hypothetical protein
MLKLLETNASALAVHDKNTSTLIGYVTLASINAEITKKVHNQNVGQAASI